MMSNEKQTGRVTMSTSETSSCQTGRDVARADCQRGGVESDGDWVTAQLHRVKLTPTHTAADTHTPTHQDR